MHNRSLSRELSLISLGLIKDKGDFKLNKFQIEEIFESALDSLINHCREELDNCESELENASQKILDSELQEGVDSSYSNVRDELKKSLTKIETVMNTLSVTLDFPKLIVSSGQIDIREDVKQRISNIINNLKTIDSDIDQVMDGWRLKRLPRIDRDIFPASAKIPEFELPKPKNNYEKADLAFALKNLLSEMDRLQSHKITFENITVESKMKQILNSLIDRDFISLPEIVQKGESKLAVSVILVAGLELNKKGYIEIVQAEQFSEVYFKSSEEAVH